MHDPRSQQYTAESNSLETVKQLASAVTSYRPSLSVVIPVFGDASPLLGCIAALRAQTYPLSRVEIIVVDNGVSHSLAAVFEQTDGFPNFILKFEPTPGSYSARNCGASSATGDFLAFTDADCIPDPFWLESVATALATRPNTVIAGRINYIDPPNRRLNIIEEYEDRATYLAHQDIVVRKGFYAMTANLAIHRSTFCSVGPFNGRLRSSGDREWVHRALRAGMKLIYDPLVVVRHPRRSSFRAMLDKKLRLAGGTHSLMHINGVTKRAKIRYIVSASPISSSIYRNVFNQPLSYPKTLSLWRLAILYCVAVAISTLTTFERCRLLFGGQPRR
jgi:glycosyltransferase involved in cell wall biosynthesis